MRVLRCKFHRIRICPIPLFSILILLLAGCAGEPETSPAAETPPAFVVITTETPEPEEPPATLRLAGQAEHPALLYCASDGRFRPEQGITRAELAEALAGMLYGFPDGLPYFTDYKSPIPGYRGAAALVNAGILSAPEGQFRPWDTVTRGELADALRRLAQSLRDRPGERAAVLAAETRAGINAPAGAGTGEEEPVTRAEAALVLERLAGREPDEAGLFLAECLPADVALDDYAWAWIADAVTGGRVPAPTPGVHRAYGWLYATWEDGTLIRDMDWGVWTFGLDGRYTTGDAELDAYLLRALADSGASGLEGIEALEAAYLYVEEIGEYLVRPEDAEPLAPGVTGWEYDRALRFFRYGGGTCYGYAAAFGLLARALGEYAYIVSAEVNQYHGAHAFVVIPENGVDWIYDPELEDTRPERHAPLALFRIEPYGYYNYWYENDWG